MLTTGRVTLGLDSPPFNLLGNTMRSQAGLNLDPAAITDLEYLRYAWFDSIFKWAPQSDLLKDRVNYQVTGANVWKHAPTLEALSTTKRRVYLSSAKRGNAYTLSDRKDVHEASLDLTVNRADRSDADCKVQGGGVLDTELDSWNGVEFIGEPRAEPVELSGCF